MRRATAIDSENSSLSSFAGRRRVLVCEDDASIRKMVTAILRHYQYDVVPVSNGVEAIAILDAPFDAIILDLMMPSSSGYDVLEHLEKTNPALLERVIVVTARAAVLRQPLQVPVAALLLKPFDIVELMAAVNRIAVDS